MSILFGLITFALAVLFIILSVIILMTYGENDYKEVKEEVTRLIQMDAVLFILILIFGTTCSLMSYDCEEKECPEVRCPKCETCKTITEERTEQTW